jgi:hypothetical protein
MGDPPRGTLTDTKQPLRHRVRPSASAACYTACSSLGARQHALTRPRAYAVFPR